MNITEIASFGAGVLFGIWPILLNKSGLSGSLGPMVLVVFTGILGLPLAIKYHGDLTSVKWVFVFLGGTTSTAGILLYNFALLKAPAISVGTLIVIQLITQATVAALYDLMVNRQMSPAKLTEFVFAGFSAYLLMKK